jgi:hypothetical protein
MPSTGSIATISQINSVTTKTTVRLLSYLVVFPRVSILVLVDNHGLRVYRRRVYIMPSPDVETHLDGLRQIDGSPINITGTSIIGILFFDCGSSYMHDNMTQPSPDTHGDTQTDLARNARHTSSVRHAQSFPWTHVIIWTVFTARLIYLDRNNSRQSGPTIPVHMRIRLQSHPVPHCNQPPRIWIPKTDATGNWLIKCDTSAQLRSGRLSHNRRLSRPSCSFTYHL